MHIVCGTRSSMREAAFRKLARYRHRVFVEQLGWPIACKEGLELDQFDQAYTEYVMAQGDDGRVCGCGRLLPTSRPYLLAEVFPQLLDGLPMPCSNDVWELSRFSVAGPSADHGRQPCRRYRRTEQLLLACVQHAAARGAARLITVSPLGIERLLNRMEVHAYRAGPPYRLGRDLVYACCIEIDDHTVSALSRAAAKPDAALSPARPGAAMPERQAASTNPRRHSLLV